jgi:hypothetical protein
MPRTRSIMVNGHPLHIVLPEETISWAEICDAAGFDGVVRYRLPGGPLVAPDHGDDCPLVDGASYEVVPQ